MKELLADASARAIRYLERLDSRSVAPTSSAIEQLRTLDEPLPTRPTDPAETLRLLDEIGSPATMGMAGPRFFGFVIGGSLPVRSPPTGWPARGIRIRPFMPNAGDCVIEQMALRWLAELLDSPPIAAAHL